MSSPLSSFQPQQTGYSHTTTQYGGRQSQPQEKYASTSTGVRVSAADGNTAQLSRGLRGSSTTFSYTGTHVADRTIQHQRPTHGVRMNAATHHDSTRTGMVQQQNTASHMQTVQGQQQQGSGPVSQHPGNLAPITSASRQNQPTQNPSIPLTQFDQGLFIEAKELEELYTAQAERANLATLVVKMSEVQKQERDTLKATTKTIKNLEAQLKIVKNESDEAQQRLQSSEQTKGTLLTELNNVQQKLSELTIKAEQSQLRIYEQHDELDMSRATNNSLTTANQELQNQIATLNERQVQLLHKLDTLDASNANLRATNQDLETKHKQLIGILNNTTAMNKQLRGDNKLNMETAANYGNQLKQANRELIHSSEIIQEKELALTRLGDEVKQMQMTVRELTGKLDQVEAQNNNLTLRQIQNASTIRDYEQVIQELKAELQTTHATLTRAEGNYLNSQQELMTLKEQFKQKQTAFAQTKKECEQRLIENNEMQAHYQEQINRITEQLEGFRDENRQLRSRNHELASGAIQVVKTQIRRDMQTITNRIEKAETDIQMMNIPEKIAEVNSRVQILKNEVDALRASARQVSQQAEESQADKACADIESLLQSLQSDYDNVQKQVMNAREAEQQITAELVEQQTSCQVIVNKSVLPAGQIDVFNLAANLLPPEDGGQMGASSLEDANGPNSLESAPPLDPEVEHDSVFGTNPAISGPIVNALATETTDTSGMQTPYVTSPPTPIGGDESNQE